MTPQQVAIDFISKFNGDSSKAMGEFSNQSQMKLSGGNAPNEKFTQVSTILNKISMIQDDVDKIGDATKIFESPAFNTMIFNRVSEMNNLLGGEIYETPDPMSLSKNVFDYEQALIEMENEIPRIKKQEDRMSALWVINELMMSIDALKGANNVQA